jgi:hypothetical protein
MQICEQITLKEIIPGEPLFGWDTESWEDLSQQDITAEIVEHVAFLLQHNCLFLTFAAGLKSKCKLRSWSQIPKKKSAQSLHTEFHKQTADILLHGNDFLISKYVPNSSNSKVHKFMDFGCTATSSNPNYVLLKTNEEAPKILCANHDHNLKHAHRHGCFADHSYTWQSLFQLLNGPLPADIHERKMIMKELVGTLVFHRGPCSPRYIIVGLAESLSKVAVCLYINQTQRFFHPMEELFPIPPTQTQTPVTYFSLSTKRPMSGTFTVENDENGLPNAEICIFQPDHQDLDHISIPFLPIHCSYHNMGIRLTKENSNHSEDSTSQLPPPLFETTNHSLLPPDRESPDNIAEPNQELDTQPLHASPDPGSSVVPPDLDDSYLGSKGDSSPPGDPGHPSFGWINKTPCTLCGNIPGCPSPFQCNQSKCHNNNKLNAWFIQPKGFINQLTYHPSRGKSGFETCWFATTIQLLFSSPILLAELQLAIQGLPNTDSLPVVNSFMTTAHSTNQIATVMEIDSLQLACQDLIPLVNLKGQQSLTEFLQKFLQVLSMEVPHLFHLFDWEMVFQHPCPVCQK